jgi:hypothetical protein
VEAKAGISGCSQESKRTLGVTSKHFDFAEKPPVLKRVLG